MNAVKSNRAPVFARRDNMVESEFRHSLVAASPSLTDRLGGINVTYLAGENMETEIALWIDSDPMPRLLKLSVPFTADFAETIAAILVDAEKIPAPDYATT